MKKKGSSVIRSIKYCIAIQGGFLFYIFSFAWAQASHEVPLPFDILEPEITSPRVPLQLKETLPNGKPSIDALYRLDPNTVDSYNIINTTTSITYCSQVAYKNLDNLVGGINNFARGDAIALWNSTNSSGSKDPLINSLPKENTDTVYDIVTFLPNLAEKKGSDWYVRQSHRFVVFLASDTKRYVLDPVRTLLTEPILLETYEEKYRFKGELYKVINSYKPSVQWKNENSYIAVYSSIELLTHSQSNIITLTALWTGDILNNMIVNNRIRYNTLNWNASASLEEWTTVTTANWKEIELSDFLFTIKKSEKKSEFKEVPANTVNEQSLSSATVIVNGKKSSLPIAVSTTINKQGLPSKKTKDNNPENTQKTQRKITTEYHEFQFGISWQHLLFSQPIKLEYNIALPDWSQVAIGVKHGNSTKFWTEWLSTSQDSQCNNGETNSPNANGIVNQGKITFRTCGASTFSLTYTGWADASHFVDNGFKEFTLSFLTGVHFPTGAKVRDVNIAISRRPIDNESPTGPWGITNCFPGEKSFQLYHPNGSSINLINAGQLTTPNTSCPQVATTFDDQTINPAITTTYVTWTYKPTAGNFLSWFNNLSPFWWWKLRMSDNTASDGIILFGFTLEIITWPKITNNIINNTVYYPENTNTGIINIDTVDPLYIEWSGLTYSLSGVDSSLFTINSSGIINWISEPQYDNPWDSNNDNNYQVSIIVTNANSETDTLNLTVSVLRAIGGSCKSQVDLWAAHTCMTTTWGTVQCRWINSSRQLADGTITQRTSPVASTQRWSSIMQIDAGTVASFAVSTTWQLRAIWVNTNGQLGDGTLTTRTAPVNILTGVLRVYNTEFHTCAIMNDTSLKCRWRNANGQVWDGTTTQRTSPVNVSLTGIADMALQQLSTCALKIDGTVRCRWSNTNGRLGDGTITQRTTPTAVTWWLTGIIQIAAGASHACALKSNGTVWCWGLNNRWQLWDGTVTQRLVPTITAGSLTGIVSIAASNEASCALKNNGKIFCRGRNSNGEVGDGTITQRTSPTAVIGMTTWSAHQIFSTALAGRHFCASSTTWALYCWGLNSNGQWGNGTTTTPSTSPIAVSGWATIDVNNACPIYSPPVIQNNSGNTITLSYDEGDSIPVIDTETSDASDSEWNGLVYTLNGPDSALFSVNNSGIVNWLSTPDYENPLDLGWNNTYNITVIVTNSKNMTDSLALIINVVKSWDLCIEGPNSFSLWSFVTKNIAQTIETESNYFTVDDQKGSNSWYYTTVSLWNLTGNSWAVILNSTINIKASPITLLSGTANPSVILDSWITSYTSIASPVVFIKRNSGSGWNIFWTYGSKITLKVDIPAYKKPDTYSGIITYTLYEN